MTYNIKIYVIFFLIIYSIALSHPFHATITSIDCKQNNKSIEVTMKLFTSDLERALRIEGRPNLKIDSHDRRNNIDSLIFDYINNNLSLSIDNKKRQFTWIAKEIENDITWCYMEIINANNFSSIGIDNKLFLSIFDDQLNICHFYCSDKAETIMLHKEKYYGEINF